MAKSLSVKLASLDAGRAVDDGRGRRAIRPPTEYTDFEAVARHGSIRKAAEALHTVSSALNRRILDLEEQLGLELFERLPRGVRLTASGEIYLDFVRRALKDLQRLEIQLAGLHGMVRGAIRIGAAESTTDRFLPTAMVEFQEKHPHICFHLKVHGPSTLRELLLNDDVDLILTHEELDSPAIQVVGTVEQRLCVLVAPDHPLAGRANVRLSECVLFPHALPDDTLAARALLDQALARSSVRLEPALVSNSIEATRVFARAKDGVCFQFRLPNDEVFPGMTVVPLVDPELSSTRLSLAVRRGRVLPVPAASFTERLAYAMERM